MKDAALAAGVGATAGALIGVAAVGVAAGAVSTTVGAVIAGAGTGLATGGGGYMTANIVTHSEFDAGDFEIASTVGAGTGAVGPLVGTTMAGAAMLNAASGAIQYEATYYHHNQSLDWDGDVLKAGALSAASTLISGPYTDPDSLFGDTRPMPTDSGAYWRRLNGYDPVYNPQSPYAGAIASGNLLKQTLKAQVPLGLIGGAISNWAAHHWIDE